MRRSEDEVLARENIVQALWEVENFWVAYVISYRKQLNFKDNDNDNHRHIPITNCISEAFATAYDHKGHLWPGKMMEIGDVI